MSPLLKPAKWIVLILLLSLAPVVAAGDEPGGEATDAWAANRRLGTGINLGNMLEAPAEGDWGARFQDRYAAIIQEAGFQHVRIPVRWSAHTSDQPPYRIDEAFLSRVRHVVTTCLDRGLGVVLNVHHFNELYEDPEAHRARLVALWTQIGEAFADAPPELYFELLNEPHGQLTSERWNPMAAELLAVVRQRHPRRPVIIGGAPWNGHASLTELRLPDEDRMLIATFHYYLPFAFTHQGASWTAPNIPPVGRGFPEEPDEPRMMAEHFAEVRRWSRRHDRPIYVGEYGSYSAADLPHRIRWTETVTDLIRRNGFSSAYWEFCSGFGAYDPDAERWRDGLRNALVPQPAAR